MHSARPICTFMKLIVQIRCIYKHKKIQNEIMQKVIIKTRAKVIFYADVTQC